MTLGKRPTGGLGATQQWGELSTGYGQTVGVTSQTSPCSPARSASGIVEWRGIHHLAMVTPDMDVTVRFYVGVLGMPLVATLMAGPMRHYFFKLGPGNTIAFFEVADAETFS